jgi:H+/Cl- antiporter ClcA
LNKNKSAQAIDETTNGTALFLSALVLATFAIGVGSWIFLAGLEAVTHLREENPKWFFFAPIAGILSGLAFVKVWPKARRGNVLLVAVLRRNDSSEDLLASVPRALAPLIVVATWISHLGGLSVGREGTAVQMAGSLAATFGRWFKVKSHGRLLLQAGIAAGFGSVFGVPLAGAIFAGEISREIRQQRVRGFSFMMCLLASLAADRVARYFGAHHAVYPQPMAADFNLKSLLALLLVGISCGLLAWGFLFLLHYFRILWAKLFATDWARPAAGGMLFSLMAFAPSSVTRYAGLGMPAILEAFDKPLLFFDPLIKLLFTVFSVGVGFAGGEVTPLFFIGATTGSALAGAVGVEPRLLAAAGLVAVFGAAAEVPLACSVMAGELFGVWGFLAAFPVCFIANWICRHSRLYDSKPEF